MAEKKLTSLDALSNLLDPEKLKELQNSSSESNSSDEMVASEQDIRVWIEKNHRGGKIVTILKGFTCSDEALKDLGKKLKNHCGTGGTEKNGEIILQGHHADKVVAYLKSNGFKAKRAGGN